MLPMSECILWEGGVTDRGYGQRRHDGKPVYVHRLAWEQQRGPIPDDMTIDHLCRVKTCINVDHMEVVTRAENSRRNRHELCRKGLHRLDEDAYTNAAGKRECVRCNRDRRRRWYAAKRAQTLTSVVRATTLAP